MAYAQQGIVPGKRISVPLDSARTVGEAKKLCAQASGVDIDMVVIYAIIGDFPYEFSNDMPVPQHPYIVLRPFIA